MQTCLICSQEFERLSSHVSRSHGVQFEEYLLVHILGGVRPKCECGCGVETPFSKSQGMRFLRYVHGHSAKAPGRLSDVSKAKIAEKNRRNMKRYYSENPEIAKEKARQLREGITADSESRRAETMKRTASGEGHRLKMSLNAKELWARGELMTIARKKAAETFKLRASSGAYDFDSRNEKISESVTRLYVEGRTGFSRGSHTSPKTGKTHRYRSTWERELMIILDSDPRVTEWEYEFDVIRYSYEGKGRRYVPDFLVTSSSGKKTLVEVKPKNLRNTPRNEAKRLAAAQYCVAMSLSYVEWQPIDGVEIVI